MIQNLGFFLVHYKFAKSWEEAAALCERGSVQVDGVVVSDIFYVPKGGSSLNTLETLYTVQLPVPRQYEVL
jgi:hypothetical protein